jgi:hypothetical protein
VKTQNTPSCPKPPCPKNSRRRSRRLRSRHHDSAFLVQAPRNAEEGGRQKILKEGRVARKRLKLGGIFDWFRPKEEARRTSPRATPPPGVDLYSILNARPEASQEDIRSAYRRSPDAHPDRDPAQRPNPRMTPTWSSDRKRMHDRAGIFCGT